MKRLSPARMVLTLLLAACGGDVTGDPNAPGGPLPESFQVEINLGGTPYASGNPNVQICMGPHPIPEGAFKIGMIITSIPYGNCGISMVIAGDIQPGTHASGNMDGFIGGGMGCTELSDPIDPGLTRPLTLEHADGRFRRGSFSLTQAFKDGSAPLRATGCFVVPYPAS